MSRRRPSVDSEHVTVDIECAACGNRVGICMLYIGASPRAGTYSTGGGVRFEDRPTPEASSGKVRGRCGKCGADVQLRWSRVKARLDGNLVARRYNDSMRA
ncbi:hypothetical protein GCM10009718_02640 [Isoptericola halotolerans]